MSRAVSKSVYQIDFTAVACGKRVAASKRRVRWRFGFANMQALAAGRTGTDCRGSEHDVTFVWSISSGKRTVLFDGQEVHYSSSRSGVFDYSWTMKGTNHVLKIVAHASPPMSTTPGFRQYDFFVDGLSFFRLPKVFRLGLNPNDPRASAASARDHSLAVRGNRYKNPDEVLEAEVPSNPDEEEAYLQEAIRQSLQDDAPPATPASASASVDLLGFDSPPVPAPAPTQNNNFFGGVTDYTYGAPPAQQQLLALPYSSAYPGAENQYAAPPQQQQQLALSAAPADPWAAAPAPAYTAPSSAASYQQQQQPQQQASYASNQLVPAPSSASPYAISAALGAAANPFGFAAASDNSQPPMTDTSGAAMSSYPMQQQQQAPAPAPYNTVLASYGSGSGGGGPAEGSGYVTSNPSTSQWTPPPPIVTTAPYGMPQAYSTGTATQHADVPSAVSPQAISTPSTLGFGSPAANFAGFQSPPAAAPGLESNGNNEQAGEWENQPEMQATELFGSDERGNDNSEGNQTERPKSLVDEAYSKLVDFESFSISSKKDAPRSNPFEMMSSTIGGTKSLADIRATKTHAGPKKEVMKTPVPAPALVSSQQQSHGYGQPPAQAYSQPMPPQPQPPQMQFSPGFAQPQEQYPQAFVAQQSMMGQPMSQQQQQQSFGQSYYNPMAPPPQQQPPPPQALQQQQQESAGQFYNPMQQQPPPTLQQQPGYGQQPQHAPQNTFGQPQHHQPANLSYF